MPFVLFHDLFPEVAEEETRTLILTEESTLPLPKGDYSFLEMFCNDEGCDCRRVMFMVVTSSQRDSLAVVSWGWEPLSFYSKWMRVADRSQAQEIKGPSLNFGSPQSKLAPVILSLVEGFLLKDKAYTDRVKRHYAMVREQVDGPRGRKRKVAAKDMKVRNPTPKTWQDWMDEIVKAYLDAREAIPYGRFVGQVIAEKDLYHMAPAVCLKFRGIKKSKRVLEEATIAALTSYSVMQGSAGELLAVPQVAFAFCYLASHFGLDLVDEDLVNSVMEFLVANQGGLLVRTHPESAEH